MVKGLLSKFAFSTIFSNADILYDAEHLDLISCKLVMPTKSTNHGFRIVAVDNLGETFSYGVTAVTFFLLLQVCRDHFHTFSFFTFKNI